MTTKPNTEPKDSYLNRCIGCSKVKTSSPDKICAACSNKGFTTPIATDPLEAILHKHITYSEGFDAYIVDDVDAFREDLERLVLQAKIDSLSRVVLEYGNRRATIWLGTGKYADLQDYIAQLTKELEQLNGDKDDMWLLREQ